ncbi:DNA polymerase III subunit gamma and tau [Cellulomonas sp. NPDC089187]|uniref:DNA polymerase III subunit gamma and tau n=1 Tax=Cellulomonas sp. NPDC089187 TaxID=3154970 RepID=UPI003413A262
MTTALYRRYRPETFAEVVGQDHVTGPLRQALRSGQINHAYLFSGPRGCGKTTSARILARCLNCAEGPTDTPCGVCESCVELARGGPGSLDVVEIDAASHGGVDDARDLRERATFAPARDRYKVFILDEAHMVSPQGFNALLKIVEEPPEHVKFIFATTEPDKVIGTIRSRTHHYPFRLVPPEIMTDYLGQICGTEGITVGSGVLPLVVRAGGGSVRDSLSVLDQLIAGSGPQGLVYEDAVALLGYTHASLLDDLIEAIAARDGASAFRVVERVISTGHEPRRFVEDLLERLRDLIVLQASGDAAEAVLRDIPGDQLARMRTQAQHLGASELSRSADLANAALTEMSGATSPRLHLELLMARLLLPAMDDSSAGLGARVDRLERIGVSAAPANAVSPATPVERVTVVTGPAESAAPARPETATSGAALARAAMTAGKAGGASDGSSAPGTREASAGRPDSAAAQDAGTSGTSGTAAHATATPGAGGAVEAPDAAQAVMSPGAGQTAMTPAAKQAVETPVGTTGVAGAAPGLSPQDATDVPSGARQEPAGWEDVPTATSAGASTSTVAQPVESLSARAAAPQVSSADTPTEDPDTASSSVPAGGAPADPGTATSAQTGAGQDTEMLRRRWPEVLETLARLKKTTWVLISQNAQVVTLDATTLTLGFTAPGLATAFRAGQHAELVHQAVRETLGFDVRVEGVLAGDTPAGNRPAPAAESRPIESDRTAQPRPVAASREHDSADSPDVLPAADHDAPADPWAQAVPTATPAPTDAPASTDAPAEPAAPTTEQADPPNPVSGPARGNEKATAPQGSTAPAAASTDWPDVAPIPGTATGSDGTSAAPAATSETPADAEGTADVEWPAVAVIPGPASGERPAAEPSAATTPTSDARSVDGPADAASHVRSTPGAPSDGGSATGDATSTPAPTAPVRSTTTDARLGTTPADAHSPAARQAEPQPPVADEPPPPWDEHPDDPGAGEPPEDPWASPTSPRTGASQSASAGSSRSTATHSTAPSSTPATTLSGADRVRAAMVREPAQRATATPSGPNWADDEPSMDDPDIGSSGMAGIPLVAQALGGVIIEEQIDDPM